MNHLYPPFDNPAIRRVVLEAPSQADFMAAAAGDDPKLWRKDVDLFTPGTAMANNAGLAILTGPRALAKVKHDLVAAGYRGRARRAHVDQRESRAGRPRRGHERPAAAPRDERAVRRVRLGHAGDAPCQQGARRPGRLEHLHHDLDRPRHGQPGGGAGAALGRREGALRLAEPARTGDPAESLDRGARSGGAPSDRGPDADPAMRDVLYLPNGQYFYRTAFRRDLRDVVDDQFVFWNARRA